jgi:uncharacterized protein YecE (DUF72 family)
MTTQGTLFRSAPRDTSLRVGPAGWQYKDWNGVVYPGAGRSFDPLGFLAGYYDTIEINSSFYRPPRPEDCAAWARRVAENPRFRFTAKAWQRLSHEREEAADASLKEDCDQVRRSMAPLMDAGVLGALLVQFPWRFRCTPENVTHLDRLLGFLRDFPVVVEVRHGSWDNPQFYQFLREREAAFCNVDQPVMGDSLRPSARVTSRIGYIRLHGRNYETWFKEDAGRDARYDYLYTEKEIGQISKLVRTIQQDAEETYAITNNHFRGQALVNAVELLAELDPQPPAVPPLLVRHYPRLARIAGPADTSPA